MIDTVHSANLRKFCLYMAICVFFKTEFNEYWSCAMIKKKVKLLTKESLLSERNVTAGCPKALSPSGCPLPQSPYGRMDGCMLMSQPKFLASKCYQICLLMVLHSVAFWRNGAPLKTECYELSIFVSLTSKWYEATSQYGYSITGK